MVLELTEFQPATLRSFVQNVQNQNEYRLASAFPDEQVFDDKFVYNIIKGTPVIASKVTGFNSSAPIRSMAEAEQVIGRMTKLQDAYYIDEELDRKITAPRQGTNERGVAIQSALKNIGNLAIGVDDTVEYLRAKLVYDGIVEYSDPWTQTKVSFEVNRPDGNNITVATPWSDGTSNPFEDLREAVAQYQTATESNKMPDRVDIAPDVEATLLGHPFVKQMVYGSSEDGRMVDAGQLQTLFTRMQLPQYYVNRDATTFEDIVDGERTTVRRQHLESGKVVLYDNEMGSTARGDVKVNGTYQHGKFVDAYTEKNPETETVIVGEAVIPALKAVNNNVIMQVLGTP